MSTAGKDPIPFHPSRPPASSYSRVLLLPSPLVQEGSRPVRRPRRLHGPVRVRRKPRRPSLPSHPEGGKQDGVDVGRDERRELGPGCATGRCHRQPRESGLAADAAATRVAATFSARMSPVAYDPCSCRESMPTGSTLSKLSA